MSTKKSNKNVSLVKRVQNRFIQIDEKCIENMDLYAMAVYQQLRLLSDFTKDCDEIELSVPELSRLSKISERKTYYSLNELEYTHGVVQRLNYHHFKYGQVSAYNVARDYNYFKVVQNLHTTAPHAGAVDNPVQTLTTPAPHAEATAPHAEATAPNDIPIVNNNNLSHNYYHKKQNKGAEQKTNTIPSTSNPYSMPVKNPVSVFSDSYSIKNHILQICANRNAFVEEETIDQIIFYIGEMRDFDSVMKKTNIALKLVRTGKWNIPNGYKGITSKSIREKEERETIEKQKQYKEEAIAFQALNKTIVKGKGFEEFSSMIKTMKEGIRS